MSQFLCEQCGYKYVDDSLNSFCPECLCEVNHIPVEEIVRVVDEISEKGYSITSSFHVAEFYRASGFTVLSDTGSAKFILRIKK